MNFTVIEIERKRKEVKRKQNYFTKNLNNVKP